MNRPEHELAKEIVRHLDYGVDQLEPAARERLAAARKLALSRYREAPQPVLGLAWVGGAVARVTGHLPSNARLMVAAAALMIATAGAIYWQTTNGTNPAELADLDSGLLTDELPLNAFLDKGFDSWLKRSSR